MRALPALYAGIVVVIAATRALVGHPIANALALTPDRLGAGHVWLLATSAVIVNGPALPQIAALVPTLAIAQRRFGAAVVCTIAVIAHVGATLLAYAVLALATGDADGAHNRQLDYGTSAVWLGALGAISVSAWRRRGRHDMVLVALGGAAFAAGVTLFPLLAATEHGLAFVLGAALAARRR